MIAIVGLVIIVLLVVIGFVLYKRKQDQDLLKKKKIIASTVNNKESVEALDKSLAVIKESQKEIDDAFGSGVPDVDLNVNDVYLTEGLAPENQTAEIAKELGTALGISAAQVASVQISKRAAKYLGKKAISSIVGKTIIKMIPKVAIKSSTTLAKTLGKLSNPVGWALLVFDGISLIWDLADTGKLSGYLDAKSWLKIRDDEKKEMEKALKKIKKDPTEKIIVGPFDKIKRDEKKWDKITSDEIKLQAIKYTDKIINEMTDIDSLTLEQRKTKIASKLTEAKPIIINMAMKSLCIKNGGKYLGKDICSYPSKSACDNSFTWPIPDNAENQLYAQWDGNKCVFEPWAGAVRHTCNEQGSANIGYDYDNKVCKIKEPYCTQYGYSYKAKDPEAKNFPNCYKTGGRKVADVLVGETISQDFQNLFSSEKNCGDRCTDDQYCYTISGRGGICLAKNDPGEACPAGQHESCRGGSRCELSSEGYGAAVGTSVAVYGLAAASLGAGAAIGAAAARSIAANHGMCTVGSDGKNKSSASNPGHYLPLGMKGCSVAWKCPTKVANTNSAYKDKNGRTAKTVKYHCENIFKPCQPPKKTGEFCLQGQDWCHSDSFCNAASKCQKKKNDGEYCPGIAAGAYCKSGKCGSMSNCLNKDGKAVKGSTCSIVDKCASGLWCGGIPIRCRSKGGVGEQCGLNSNNCKSGLFCNNYVKSTCQRALPDGSNCLKSNACKSKSCLGGICAKTINGKKYIPKGKSCILANTRCEPSTYCNGFTCVKKNPKGTPCVSHNVCQNRCEYSFPWWYCT